MAHHLTSPAEAHASVTLGKGLLIDVRTPAEFLAIHATGAHLVPLDVFNADKVREVKATAQDGPVFILCGTGIRAVKAAEALAHADLGEIHVVDGGTKAWDAANLPVERGPETISLERQVRIGAGILVLAGVSLGWFVHPGFFLLSAFVGAGLTFAGITDWCGLALLLAKAPWNRSA